MRSNGYTKAQLAMYAAARAADRALSGAEFEYDTARDAALSHPHDRARAVAYAHAEDAVARARAASNAAHAAVNNIPANVHAASRAAVADAGRNAMIARLASTRPKRNARQYRQRRFAVERWNVEAQRFESLGEVAATSSKYALEEFMASRPGYSLPHLRAVEVTAARAPKRNAGPDADDWRGRLIEDVSTWAYGAPEDMGVHRIGRYEPDVGRWEPIAVAAAVPMRDLRASAKAITAATPYLAAERRLGLRSELAARMTDHLRRASDSDIERYAYFREDYMAAEEEGAPHGRKRNAGPAEYVVATQWKDRAAPRYVAPFGETLRAREARRYSLADANAEARRRSERYGEYLAAVKVIPQSEARNIAEPPAPVRFTAARSRALGTEFGREAVKVELRSEQERHGDRRKQSRDSFLYAVQELAFWDMGESGSPHRHDIEHSKALLAAFNLGVRDAVRESTVKRNARPPALAPSRPRAPAPPRRSGHAPFTVYYFLRSRDGIPLDVIQAPHNGTVPSIREAAKRLQHEAADAYDHSFAGSQMIATDGQGAAGWAISPNLAHINPVGSDEAAYTLGDLSRAPAAAPPPAPPAFRLTPPEIAPARRARATAPRR